MEADLKIFYFFYFSLLIGTELMVTDKTNLSISKGDKKISSNICTAKLYLIVNVKNSLS